MPFRAWSDLYFSGDFDEISIWNRALTPAEITQLFRANTQQVFSVAANANRNAVPSNYSHHHYTPVANPPATPPPAAPVAPPRETTPKLISYSYDAKTAKGLLAVDIAAGGIEASRCSSPGICEPTRTSRQRPHRMCLAPKNRRTRPPSLQGISFVSFATFAVKIDASCCHPNDE